MQRWTRLLQHVRDDQLIQKASENVLRANNDATTSKFYPLKPKQVIQPRSTKAEAGPKKRYARPTGKGIRKNAPKHHIISLLRIPWDGFVYCWDGA